MHKLETMPRTNQKTWSVTHHSAFTRPTSLLKISCAFYAARTDQAPTQKSPLSGEGMPTGNHKNISTCRMPIQYRAGCRDGRSQQYTYGRARSSQCRYALSPYSNIY